MKLALGLLERPVRIDRSILWKAGICYSMIEAIEHIGGGGIEGGELLVVY